MTLSIPVERHVFSFLTSPEMYGHELPLRVRKDTLLGLMIIMLASKGPIGLEDYYGKRFVPELPNDLVLLPVDTTFPMNARFVDEDNLLYIGQALSNIFELQVVFFSMGYTARAGSERGAIAKLYQRFSMADDPIKQEALRGMCKRFREKIRNRQWKRQEEKPSSYVKKQPHFNEKPSRKVKISPTKNDLKI